VRELCAPAPRLERFDLRRLFDDVVADARGAARNAGKALVVEVTDDVPEVVADRELLRRVIENLLDNAFKYAPRDSELRIEATRAGGGDYFIRLRDQGPGIPAADRERIFDPYVRLERDAAGHARTSRGLGLAFRRLAVDAHGGRIWVADNEPRGSAFVIQLAIDPVVANVSTRTAQAKRRATS
jgi:two-component system sensor histidine kinase/response regulator